MAEDIAVLTLISTLLLMFLTLSTMFLLHISSFNFGRPSIWKFTTSTQSFVSSWSVIIGLLWFIYILFFDRANFSNLSFNQSFIYSLTLFTVILLMIVTGVIGFLIARFLLPENIAINRTKKEVGL